MAVKSQYLQCSSFEIPGVQWRVGIVYTWRYNKQLQSKE